MTADRIVYIEQKMQAVRSGSYAAQQRGAGENVVAHYGLVAERGENKWVAIEKLIRRLRKMSAAGALADAAAGVPERFKGFEKFIIPAHILLQAKSDAIDRDELRRANGLTSAD